LGQLLGLFLPGAGHGWVAPFFLSVALWFMIPLTLALAWPTVRPSRPVLLTLTALALAADALLLKLSLGEFAYIGRYVEINGAIGYAIIGCWLALWLFWQILLLYALVARHDDD
jgi:hypothetical protein